MADASIKNIPGIFTQSDIERLDKISADKENSEKQKKQVLDQDAFMKILAAQLKHQDPLSPMKDQEFIGQMAQFNSLNAMNNLVELTEANSETDTDIAIILAAMGEGIERLVNKFDPDETTDEVTDETTDDSDSTEDVRSDSEKILDVSTETLAEIKKMTTEMKNMTEALRAYTE